MNTMNKNFTKRISNSLKSGTVLVGLVFFLMVIVASIFSEYFLTLFNLQSLIRDIAFVGMIAVAQSLLLLIGELDLSVGSIATLSGVLGGIMMVSLNLNSAVAFVLGIVIGAIFGIINGLLITKLKISSMVATIGMSSVYGGVTFVITRGKAVTGIPEDILFLGQGDFLLVPLPFWFSLAVLIAIVFMASKTKTGRYIYAIGNGKEVARIIGISVDKIRLMIFCLVGGVSALAGMLYIARLGSAQSAVGTAWPLNSIAACVIGGVLLTGGVGNPIGAYFGAAIISLISNIIVLFGVSIYWQRAVSGIVIIIAIALPSIIRIIREIQMTNSYKKS